MGYYNQNYPPNPHRKKGNSWVPLVLGIVVGALLVSIAVPRFLEMSEQAKTRSARNNSNEINTQEVVSLDVSTRITEVVEVVTPTVVGITNIVHRADFLEQQQESEAGTGSGVIYKKDNLYAYIVTNHHVI